MTTTQKTTMNKRKTTAKPSPVIHYKAPPFKGVDWSHSTQRPGCMDHLQHPSRRGDELVPHMGKMMHMVSNVKEFASINQKMEIVK